MNAPATFTSKQFERLVRSGGLGDMRVELRRGMIVKISPQYVPHATIKRLLAKALEAGLATAGAEWLVDQEVSVTFDHAFEPLPDIVVWDRAAAADLDGPVPGAAVKLIVEVSDTSLGDDLGEKLEDYARAGLAEYWVADIKGKLLLRHADPSPAGYARREPLRFGEPATSLVHAGLSIDTAALR